MAIKHSFVLPFNQWQSKPLDSILVTGNNLCLKINKHHDYLLSSDIHQVITEYGWDFK